MFTQFYSRKLTSTRLLHYFKSCHTVCNLDNMIYWTANSIVIRWIVCFCIYKYYLFMFHPRGYRWSSAHHGNNKSRILRTKKKKSTKRKEDFEVFAVAYICFRVKLLRRFFSYYCDGFCGYFAGIIQVPRRTSHEKYTFIWL